MFLFHLVFFFLFFLFPLSPVLLSISVLPFFPSSRGVTSSASFPLILIAGSWDHRLNPYWPMAAGFSPCLSLDLGAVDLLRLDIFSACGCLLSRAPPGILRTFFGEEWFCEKGISVLILTLLNSSICTDATPLQFFLCIDAFVWDVGEGGGREMLQKPHARVDNDRYLLFCLCCALLDTEDVGNRIKIVV